MSTLRKSVSVPSDAQRFQPQVWRITELNRQRAIRLGSPEFNQAPNWSCGDTEPDFNYRSELPDVNSCGRSGYIGFFGVYASCQNCLAAGSRSKKRSVGDMDGPAGVKKVAGQEPNTQGFIRENRGSCFPCDAECDAISAARIE